jgi:hypothetical protein
MVAYIVFTTTTGPAGSLSPHALRPPIANFGVALMAVSMTMTSSYQARCHSTTGV